MIVVSQIEMNIYSFKISTKTKTAIFHKTGLWVFDATSKTKISYGPPIIAYFDGKGSGFTFRNSSDAGEGASTFGNEQINIYGNNFGK